MKRSLSIYAVAASAVLLGAAAVEAAPLVDFKPVPTSAALPEFTFAVSPSAADFQNGPGSVSHLTDKGGNPLSTAAVGGLEIETPLSIAPASAAGQVNTGSGSTQFFDTTFSIAADVAGPVSSVVVPGPNLTFLVQALTSGTFQIRASNTSPAAGTLLLSGTFTDATIGGALGANTAFLTANSITYTGGLIFNALVAAGGTAGGGSLSISMNDLTAPLSIAGVNIAPFNANATGLLSTPAIPEPASVGTLAVAGLGLLARRRRA